MTFLAFSREGDEVSKAKSKGRQPDPFHLEARRLAQLPPREREEALAVHRRIADDAGLSGTTRDYARYVADTLERHLRRLEGKKRKSL
jgi:hypothetical protein